jgi:hypothetical protein
MESSISPEEKNNLTAMRSLYNPVELQHSVHMAVNEATEEELNEVVDKINVLINE